MHDCVLEHSPLQEVVQGDPAEVMRLQVLEARPGHLPPRRNGTGIDRERVNRGGRNEERDEGAPYLERRADAIHENDVGAAAPVVPKSHARPSVSSDR